MTQAEKNDSVQNEFLALAQYLKNVSEALRVQGGQLIIIKPANSCSLALILVNGIQFFKETGDQL